MLWFCSISGVWKRLIWRSNKQMSSNNAWHSFILPNVHVVYEELDQWAHWTLVLPSWSHSIIISSSLSGEAKNSIKVKEKNLKNLQKKSMQGWATRRQWGSARWPAQGEEPKNQVQIFSKTYSLQNTKFKIRKHVLTTKYKMQNMKTPSHYKIQNAK